MSKLTRKAYWSLIKQDLAWLRKIPRTLERDHIEHIVKQSIVHEYGAAIATLDGKPAAAEQGKEGS